jgi:hypothetical protein
MRRSMAAIAMRANMTKRKASKGAISQVAQTFGVSNFVWASSYVLSIPLGGALIDPRDDATFHPSLTVVCLMMLLLVRRVA